MASPSMGSPGSGDEDSIQTRTVVRRDAHPGCYCRKFGPPHYWDHSSLRYFPQGDRRIRMRTNPMGTVLTLVDQQ